MALDWVGLDGIAACAARPPRPLGSLAAWFVNKRGFSLPERGDGESYDDYFKYLHALPSGLARYLC